MLPFPSWDITGTLEPWQDLASLGSYLVQALLNEKSGRSRRLSRESWLQRCDPAPLSPRSAVLVSVFDFRRRLGSIVGSDIY